VEHILLHQNFSESFRTLYIYSSKYINPFTDGSESGKQEEGEG
jgi:hypothetical protein